MKLRHKIASVCLVLLAGAVLVSFFVLSYESACGTAPSLPHVPSMKAVVHRCYGSPDVLVLEDVAKPSPTDDEVLVDIHAASVNPVDWHNLRGEPYVMRISSGLGL